MNDISEMLEFSEKLENKADAYSKLAEKVKRLAKTSPGTIIIVDNFISPDGIRDCGAFDSTFIGHYKGTILKEVELGGTSDTEPSGNDIGVVVEFENKSKILKFGGREYDLPDRLKDKEFYKNAAPRFVDNPAMKGNLHNSSMILVKNEECRNFANQRLKQEYKTSLEEAGF